MCLPILILLYIAEAVLAELVSRYRDIQGVNVDLADTLDAGRFVCLDTLGATCALPTLSPCKPLGSRLAWLG